MPTAETSDPLYRRIGNEILRRMADGELPPGARLPSELDLARQFGVSRQTMRAALAALVRDGRLDRKPGRGTVVLQPKIEQRLQRFYRIEHAIKERGLQPAVRVLARGPLHAEDEFGQRACAQLGVACPESIGYLLRLRLAEGIPLLLEHIAFPLELCPMLLSEPAAGEADLAAQTLYDVFAAAAGIQVVRAREVLRPVLLTGYEARLLGVPGGVPAFEVERASFAAERPIEWRQTLLRGDQFSFVVDLLNPDDETGVS
jgi:GntR family transcriptional regulator